MKSLFRPSSLLSMLVLLAAIGFLCWINTVRARRVTYISGLTQTAPLPLDPASPTGYAGGIRELIVSEHNNDSYQWLVQTQQMLNRSEWRVRHVDYDNAPQGRELRTPSPYRWWLGLVSWIEHKRDNRSSLLSAEQAALFADPALQILALILTVIFTAWRFGATPALTLGLGFVTLFPFASAFLPGQPGDYGLSLVSALWSVLLLLAGIHAFVTPPSRATARVAVNFNRAAQHWFFIAGVAGGFGLWISVTKQLPVLLGIGLGGAIAAALTRNEANVKSLPWRAWALGGATASLAAFFIEYFPGHLDLKSWPIETIHPLYALAWLGAGEFLRQLDQVLRNGRSAWNRRRVATFIAAVLAIAAVPATILLKGDHGWLTADALAFRLTNLPGGTVSESIIAWLARDHFNATITATFAPLLLLGPAGWFLFRSDTSVVHRRVLAMASGPLLVALGFACFQLRGWSMVDATVLVLVVAVGVMLGSGIGRWLWTGLVAVLFAPSLVQILPPSNPTATDSVTETEVESLVERDLAHWLANRVGPDGAIVLAPPSLTTSLYFHGGLRGIGTPYAENKEGFAAAVRLAAASSADEAQALIHKRNVTHIIMPSWDPFLDEYAHLGSNQPEHTLIGLLHQWKPPRWLRPVPYHLPQIAGFENQAVVVFEVVEVQDNVTALSGLAEYFAEMGQLDQAVAVSRTLEQSFPTDLSAIIAQAQVAITVRDGANFTRLINVLVPRLGEDEAQGLTWERRVSLAIILAEGKHRDAAREQVERCLAELDEHLMRSLSPLALYRLQALSKAFGLEIAEPTLRSLAPTLLPPEMRSALQN